MEQNHENCKNIFWALLIFEARRETTCIQGYRPCPQQTGLHRQGSRGVVLSMKRKQLKKLISYAVIAQLIHAFVFLIYAKSTFFMTHLISAKISRNCQSDYISTSHIWSRRPIYTRVYKHTMLINKSATKSYWGTPDFAYHF